MSDLRQAAVICKREFLERVRSRWFVITTVLAPIGMIALIVVPVLIANQSTAGTRVQIADASGVLAQPLAQSLAKTLDWRAEIVSATTTDDELRARIKRSDINGFLRVPADALGSGEIVYSGDNASSQSVDIQVRLAVTSAVIAVRGERMKLTSDQLTELTTAPSFSTRHTTGETEGSSGGATFIIGYILAFVLYMVITLYCVGVMRSVVQEKSSRVMELMCAAAKPRALLAGKILGVGGAGLVQISLWLAMGGLVLAYRDDVLAMFGVHAGTGSLPPLAGAEIAVFITYFVLGFLFYSAMFAAAGAMVSSEQDSQQVQVPITLLLVIGMVSISAISNAPRGGAAVAMTNAPFWSPLLMPMRFVLGGATPAEVAISLAILVASTAVMLLIAARIYRVGVLMYGKRATLREVLHWVRRG